MSLHILLDDQAGFMISVDRFRPACVYMMFSAQIYLESPGFGDVPLPWAKIYVVLFGPLYAIVSVELLAQITSSVSRLYDTWRVLFRGFLFRLFGYRRSANDLYPRPCKLLREVYDDVADRIQFPCASVCLYDCSVYGLLPSLLQAEYEA